MVARIAPLPIDISVAVGDALTHASTSNVRAPQQRRRGARQQPYEPPTRTSRDDVPSPPAPPGEAFAAAVIASQLPPPAATSEQLRQRLDSAWRPPASSLRLTDRRA